MPRYLQEYIACNADIATVLTYCFLVTLANLPADARIFVLFILSVPYLSSTTVLNKWTELIF